MKNCSVVIIGGGITGLSTAYYLGKSHIRDVVVIEKSYIGSGSTGRCGTGIRQQFTTKEHIVLMRESVKLWQEWEEEFPLPIYFRQGGYLWLLENEEEVKEYSEYVSLQNRLGVQSRIITKEDVKEIVPQINTNGITAATWCPTDGNAYPFAVISALKLAIEQMGIEIRTFEEVTDINLKNGVIKSVLTNKETYNTDLVVNAAGFGAKKICHMVGIDIPTENYPHEITVSEPMDIFLSPMVVRGELYFTQTHNGRIIGGTDSHRPPGDSLSSTLNFLEKYSKEIINTMPILSSVKIMRQWAGFYVVTPDHHPILGPTEISNFILGCGYSGHGFMLGPIVGKLVSSYIHNRQMFLKEANNLDLDRFKEGRLLEEKAVIG